MKGITSNAYICICADCRSYKPLCLANMLNTLFSITKCIWIFHSVNFIHQGESNLICPLCTVARCIHQTRCQRKYDWFPWDLICIQPSLSNREIALTPWLKMWDFGWNISLTALTSICQEVLSTGVLAIDDGAKATAGSDFSREGSDGGKTMSRTTYSNAADAFWSPSYSRIPVINLLIVPARLVACCCAHNKFSKQLGERSVVRPVNQSILILDPAPPWPWWPPDECDRYILFCTLYKLILMYHNDRETVKLVDMFQVKIRSNSRNNRS